MKIVVVFLLLVAMSGIVGIPVAHASRSCDPALDPKNIAIEHNGLKYMPYYEYDVKEGKAAYIQVWDIETGEKFWQTQIYKIIYDQTFEHDVQDVYIKNLRIEEKNLIVTDERNNELVFDLGPKDCAVEGLPCGWGARVTPEQFGVVQLTRKELFPQEHHAAIDAVVTHIMSQGWDPAKFYIKIEPHPEKPALVMIDAYHHDRFLDKNALCDGDCSGKDHFVIYDTTKQAIDGWAHME
ncbi:hypothetical protein ACFL38_03955 [Candidatus Omnitrophota bacterium]